MAACALAASLVPSAAPAQQGPGAGRLGNESVIVDLSVLDELGPPPSVPEVLLPSVRRPSAGPAASRRIVLTPPPGVAAASRRASPPRARPKPLLRSRETPEVRARPLVPPREAVREAVRRPPPMAARKPPPPARPAAARLPPPPPAALPAKVTTAPPPPVKPPPAATAATAKAFDVGRSFRLSFAPGAATLDNRARRELDSVAAGMSGDGGLRLQLLAYAGGASETASRARRISLSRALSVRSYLIGKGVRSTRIDVRALGNKYQGGPPERVDVIVTKR